MLASHHLKLQDTLEVLWFIPPISQSYLGCRRRADILLADIFNVVVDKHDYVIWFFKKNVANDFKPSKVRRSLIDSDFLVPRENIRLNYFRATIYFLFLTDTSRLDSLSHAHNSSLILHVYCSYRPQRGLILIICSYIFLCFDSILVVFWGVFWVTVQNKHYLQWEK